MKLCKQSEINFQQRAERPISRLCWRSIAVQIIKLINKAISGVLITITHAFNPYALAHRSIIGFISSSHRFRVLFACRLHSVPFHRRCGNFWTQRHIIFFVSLPFFSATLLFFSFTIHRLTNIDWDVIA